MEKFSNKIPIIAGLVGVALEYLYSQTFYQSQAENSYNLYIFVAYKLAWVIFNAMSARLVLKYKFYFMTFFFVTYTIIETGLILGFAIFHIKYYSIPKEEHPILDLMKSVIYGGLEPFLFRVATLALELNHQMWRRRQYPYN